MKVSKKHIATGMLAIGLVTTGGAGITAAAENGGFGGGAKGDRAELAATLVGITAEEFKTRVDNGEKPQEILEAAGVTKEDIHAAREQQMQERLAQAVADGRITQEEADARIAKKEGHRTKHEAVRTAIENNDYSAWATAVAGTPQADKIDATTFPKLVEAHTLREAGDHDGAKAIMAELGLERPEGKHGHRGGPRGGQTQ